MSYDDKTRMKPPADPEPAPWDSARHLAPDPALSDAEQLRWYSAATLLLGLNVSERCRQAACRRGDEEVAKHRVGQPA
jgi:hypothetical protein